MYCRTLLCAFCRVPPKFTFVQCRRHSAKQAACFALIGTPFPLLPLFPYENSVVHPYSQRHRAEGAGGLPTARQHVADACKFILFLFFSFGNIYKKNKSTFVRPYDLHL